MKAVLSNPHVYLLFQRFVGAERLRRRVVEDYIRPNAGERVLDIGCGTADILSHLSDVDYLGFDSNPNYIRYAKNKFAGRGQFFCAEVSEEQATQSGGCDIVLATGVLHHLPDQDADKLFALAHRTLKRGGRLITLDPCYAPDQSHIAKYLISRDRGEFVRTADGYLALAQAVFQDIKTSLHHDGLRIPYTHFIMEIRKT